MCSQQHKSSMDMLVGALWCRIHPSEGNCPGLCWPLGAQTCPGQIPLGIHRIELLYSALCALSLSQGMPDVWSLILLLFFLPSLPQLTSICDDLSHITSCLRGAAPP